MKFCNVCDNMYYIQIKSEESDELMYYCRKCGDVCDMNMDETLAITSSNLNLDKSNFDDVINKYTKYDPTLPKVNFVTCPNESCDSHNEGKENNILYIRYDEKMKYVYLCSICDLAWKSDISTN